MYWWSSAASARADSPSWPNGFSTTTRPVFVRPASARPFDDRGRRGTAGSRGRRRALGALDRRADALVGRGVGEVAAHVRESLREAVEDLLRRAARRSLRSTLARALVSCSSVQSSTATPTIGQSSSPRASSRYSERKVITFARSPVMPKTTSTSAGWGFRPARPLARWLPARWCRLPSVTAPPPSVVIDPSERQSGHVIPPG